MQIDQLIQDFAENEAKRLGTRAVVKMEYPPGAGPVVTIEPRNGKACKIVFHAENDDRVVLNVGSASTVEVWRSRDDAHDFVIDMVRSWLFAVSEGRVCETVWTRRGRITHARIAAVLDGAPYSSRTSYGGRGLFDRKEVIQFAPY